MGAQSHVWTPVIVMTNPRLQRLPQMCFRQRDQPVQTFSPNRRDGSLADRIRRWASRRALQHTQSQSPDGLVEIC